MKVVLYFCRLEICRQWTRFPRVPHLIITMSLFSTRYRMLLYLSRVHVRAPSTECRTNPSGVTRNFFSGGVQQIQLRTEGRENGDLGAVRSSTQFANEWNRILIRLLRMYIPRNSEFGSALSKRRNFGGLGRGLNPPNPAPLSTQLDKPIAQWFWNVSAWNIWRGNYIHESIKNILYLGNDLCAQFSVFAGPSGRAV
jgi:hypothetical protein